MQKCFLIMESVCITCAVWMTFLCFGFCIACAHKLHLLQDFLCPKYYLAHQWFDLFNALIAGSSRNPWAEGPQGREGKLLISVYYFILKKYTSLTQEIPSINWAYFKLSWHTLAKCKKNRIFSGLLSKIIYYYYYYMSFCLSREKMVSLELREISVPRERG